MPKIVPSLVLLRWRERLTLVLMDDLHQVVQQLALLMRANMTHGGFIQQAFHTPK
jgi:hypothetical protein